MQESPPQSIRYADIQILLIEDNLAEARLLQEILKDSPTSQFSVIHVERLEAAISQLSIDRFDVALLDLTLPDSNGLDSLDTLAKISPSLPIVILTNTNDEELAFAAVRHGAQDYLIKRRVSLDSLVRAIRYAIERKQAQAALREANETLELRVQERTAALQQEIESRENIQNRLVLAQQAGKIGTFEWDIQTNSIIWSVELEALYGLPPGSFGQDTDRWLATIHPEDRQKVREEINRSIQDLQELDLEFRIIYPDEIVHWISVKSNVFLDKFSQLNQMIGIHIDITEKKQLEAQFLRAQRLESLGTLATGIAHDLNNILTPILSVAQLLPLRLPNLDDRSQHLLEILEGSTHRGVDLIKQILSFASGIEGKLICLQPSHIIIDVRKIVQQLLPKSIEIEVTIAPDLWMILSDVTQLHQVLMNLCINARDAMPQGGKLTIEATNRSIDKFLARLHLDAQVANYVKINVTDTGTGIPPQLIHRIFDPFFTTKDVGKGTGLGLSAVLGIVKSHGGFLDVQSDSNGTQFQIYLPTCNIPTQPAQHDPKLPLGQQKLILVIDDELAIGELIKTILETYNYRVIVANDGAAAIAIYADNRDEISSILIDMMMPVMDGITTINALHQLNPHLPIVAMSGLNSAEAIDKAKRFGCQHFLTKPFTIGELLQTVADSLSSQ